MRVIIVASLVLAAAACGGSDNGNPTVVTDANKTIDVITDQENFLQPLVTLSPGDTVRWNFSRSSTDGLGHDVHFNPRIAGSPANIGSPGSPLTSGSETRVFSMTGDFHYVCDLHGSMAGEVVVQ